MADAKAELIRLAGQMIRGESMPDIESWNWPNRATNKLWAQAIQAEEAAHEKCKQWALAIKEIADALPAEQPAQGVPDGWKCSACGVDRTKVPCPKGDVAALNGNCPMTAKATLSPNTRDAGPAAFGGRKTRRE